MTYRFVVEEGKIAEFAAAVGDDNPAHRDREAAAAQGFPAIPAPLTFCASSALWYRGPHPLAGRRLDLTRVLHGETEIELCRPLLAGDELIVEPTFAGTEEKQGQRGGRMRIHTLENTYRDAAGEVVLVERWRLVETATTVEA
ncbi:FAS1-like dehydratase domain-containing protein [Mycobacterium xenopi]|uniref:FAS1-like dehydratase domain-containing protein n=1 Tax=Mycobacterium xenopi TaxID=1789 RepID=A0AAD1H4X7_MYCXE|nr:MaoC family dehydratase N-terminal domain-containing protein [Mycobacterium xenopi]MDA3642315.1 MaoC family dehydratase N-terminal domain-containing protein [Mycobacterium xenopi]MDA3660144.1 MaoC family dehydratase N-terminal domain-containing protein [Mycobacterium xenopi]MDA3664954.1 MaoC family dehydratase N-terminal domain-containing protein [Mycobacterium xenopi]ORX19560.1 hypothetical protein AWC32_10180 [Mycobacterium xenopi]SPX90229.1 acyl dehydratase [Mycobacterium xenopi]